MKKILERLEAGLYREIRLTRYTVRCDGAAEAAELPYFGVYSTLTEEFVNEIRFDEAREPELWARFMNDRDGPLVIDVEADIRTLLGHIGDLS